MRCGLPGRLFLDRPASRTERGHRGPEMVGWGAPLPLRNDAAYGIVLRLPPAFSCASG